MSEIQLAAAVIHRALEDAITPDERLARPRIIQTPAGPRRTFTPGLKPREREEAVRFLLDTAPGWAGARDAWCEQAELDPATIRRHALRQIPRTSIPADVCRALRLPAAPTPLAVRPAVEAVAAAVRAAAVTDLAEAA